MSPFVPVESDGDGKFGYEAALVRLFRQLSKGRLAIQAVWIRSTAEHAEIRQPTKATVDLQHMDAAFRHHRIELPRAVGPQHSTDPVDDRSQLSVSARRQIERREPHPAQWIDVAAYHSQVAGRKPPVASRRGNH